MQGKNNTKKVYCRVNKMAKKGGNVFRNPADEPATKVATLPDLTAYQAKWGGAGRPSPKTQGIDAEGNPFQKYGTQQLSYVDPTQPALGVVERDVVYSISEAIC